MVRQWPGGTSNFEDQKVEIQNGIIEMLAVKRDPLVGYQGEGFDQ